MPKTTEGQLKSKLGKKANTRRTKSNISKVGSKNPNSKGYKLYTSSK